MAYLECVSTGCGNKVFSRLLCRKHYEEDRLATADPCSFSGCNAPAYRGQLCSSHYRNHLLAQRPMCLVTGCGQPQKNLTSGLCGRHEFRIRKHASAEQPRPEDWGAREKHPNYKQWVWHKRKGAAGIADVWRTDFWRFVADVGIRPAGHSLRRPDTTHPLGPDNWFWKESIGNKSSAEYAREWRKRNPDLAKNSDLKSQYGIDLAQYEALVRAQEGVCAICALPERAVGRDGAPRRMPVDHDHETGKVRGLLCTACNRALGLFGDNQERLAAAVAYLKKHQQG